MKLYVDYDGTWIPDSICPEPTGQTGHHPPRPRFCYGGPHAMQQALKLAGYNPGPVDGKPGSQTLSAIAAVAAKHGIPWNGDPFSVGPEICTAVIIDAIAKVPCPDYGPLEVGCVRPPTTPPSLPGAPPPPPPSNGGRVVIGSKAALLRQVRPAPARQIVAAKDSLLRRVVSTEAGGEPEPPPAQPPPQELPMNGGGVPTWAYIAGGAVVVGGVAYFVLRKK
jgi:peptidoglycan hydrolase-like protein with peptidoglycan-binding domain